MPGFLERGIGRINSASSRQAVRDYITCKLAQGIRPRGLHKEVYTLKALANSLGSPLEEATKSDIQSFMLSLEQGPKANTTKNIYRATIKRFYGREDPRVSWLKVRPRIITPKNPEDMLSREELHNIIEGMPGFYSRGRYTTRRERQALIMFLYDSALRPREFRALNRQSLYIDGGGMWVIVPHVKTPARKIFLVESLPYAEDIPFNRLSESGMGSLFRLLERHFKKVGILPQGKRLYHYILRHSRLTELARWGWTEPKLCRFAGWQLGSVMPRVYLHLSDMDMKVMMVESMNQQPVYELDKIYRREHAKGKEAHVKA